MRHVFLTVDTLMQYVELSDIFAALAKLHELGYEVPKDLIIQHSGPTDIFELIFEVKVEHVDNQLVVPFDLGTDEFDFSEIGCSPFFENTLEISYEEQKITFCIDDVGCGFAISEIIEDLIELKLQLDDWKEKQNDEATN